MTLNLFVQSFFVLNPFSQFWQLSPCGYEIGLSWIILINLLELSYVVKNLTLNLFIQSFFIPNPFFQLWGLSLRRYKVGLPLNYFTWVKTCIDFNYVDPNGLHSWLPYRCLHAYSSAVHLLLGSQAAILLWELHEKTVGSICGSGSHLLTCQ